MCRCACTVSVADTVFACVAVSKAWTATAFAHDSLFQANMNGCEAPKLKQEGDVCRFIGGQWWSAKRCEVQHSSHPACITQQFGMAAHVLR